MGHLRELGRRFLDFASDPTGKKRRAREESERNMQFASSENAQKLDRNIFLAVKQSPGFVTWMESVRKRAARLNVQGGIVIAEDKLREILANVNKETVPNRTERTVRGREFNVDDWLAFYKVFLENEIRLIAERRERLSRK